MEDKIEWLNQSYGGDWFYNEVTEMLEDYTTDRAFLPEDV
jgi:hypothetical protein